MIWNQIDIVDLATIQFLLLQEDTPHTDLQLDSSPPLVSSKVDNNNLQNCGRLIPSRPRFSLPSRHRCSCFHPNHCVHRGGIDPMCELSQVRCTSNFGHVAVVINLKFLPRRSGPTRVSRITYAYRQPHEDADHFAVCVALRLLLIDDRFG